MNLLQLCSVPNQLHSWMGWVTKWSQHKWIKDCSWINLYMSNHYFPVLWCGHQQATFKKIWGIYQEYIHYLNSQPGDKIHVSREKQVDMLMIYLSGSTTKRCLNHIFGTLPLYVDWIHMFKTNPYSRHIWISFLKIWFMIHYYAPMKVWNLKVPLMVLKMVPPKRMTPKTKMSLSTSLNTSDNGCRNTYLTIYLPIYLLARNLYLITNNDFDLFIQAYFYYHVIVVAMF